VDEVVCLSDYVIDTLYDYGVDHLFMLPGGGCMYLVDALGRHGGLKFTCNLHEQGCAVAAEAYGQYRQDLGVALVTTGPGGTNALTGVAAAWTDSTPCLFLSGQVKRSDMLGNTGVRQRGFQEIDIVSMVAPICKYAVVVHEPESIRYHMEKALYIATHGRPGPVWLDIPLDVQAANICPRNQKGFVVSEQPSLGISNEALSDLAITVLKSLSKSERPVVLVGNGVRLSGCIKETRKFLEQLGFPILTTWKMIDFLEEDHPLFCGRPGAVGQRGANFVQQNSDCLLILGARLDLGQVAYDHDNFAPHAQKIMVDIDAAEIKKLGDSIDVPIHADVGKFVHELRRQRPVLSSGSQSKWLSWAKCCYQSYPVVLPEYRKQQGFVNDYVLIETLSDLMSEQDLLVPGSSGACSERSMQAFNVKQNQRIINSQALGPMGFGIPAAIGACIAAGGERRTVTLDGDGGFMMNIQELETVHRLNLPIKFFVLNNAGYGSIRSTQLSFFDGRYVASDASSGLTLPDICKLAKAFGLQTARLTDHSDIKIKVQQILDSPGPLVCEVMVNPNQVTAPKVMSHRCSDGKMESMPMEDMTPLLSRREFHDRMNTFQKQK